MNITTVIGIGASLLTATAMLPQFIKLIKEKKAEAVSLLMLSILFAGVLLWIVYGVLKEDVIIIVSNSISLLINLATAILTLIYKQKKQ